MSNSENTPTNVFEGMKERREKKLAEAEPAEKDEAKDAQRIERINAWLEKHKAPVEEKDDTESIEPDHKEGLNTPPSQVDEGSPNSIVNPESGNSAGLTPSQNTSGSEPTPVQFEFDEEFEQKLLAQLVRDKELFDRCSHWMKPNYFVNKFCEDIYRLASRYVEKYNELIPQETLRQEIIQMYKNQKKKDVPIDHYWEVVVGLYARDLSGGGYTQDKVLYFAQAQETANALKDGAKRIIGGKDLKPILEGITKALAIGAKPKFEDNYTFVNGKELITMEEPEKKWLWDGVLLTGGLSLLIAKPKVGKTIFALNLALCCSRGEPFLGKSMTQGPVIYLALEESQTEVKKSLIAFEKTRGENPSLPDFHFGAAPTEAIQKLEKAMDEKKPKLVVIDILQKFLKLKKIEDYAEVITKLEPVMNIARKLDCHIMLTHHAPKAERELIDSALGSTGLTASVDTVILIKKDAQERRSFFTAQRYRKTGIADIKNWVIALAEDEITLELAGTIGEANSKDTKEQILKLLENIGVEKFYSEPMSEPQIRDEIKKPKSFTLKCLKELYQEGRIKRDGTGHKNSPFKYSLSE